jgi:hypothetical protein
MIVVTNVIHSHQRTATAAHYTKQKQNTQHVCVTQTKQCEKLLAWITVAVRTHKKKPHLAFDRVQPRTGPCGHVHILLLVFLPPHEGAVGT